MVARCARRCVQPQLRHRGRSGPAVHPFDARTTGSAPLPPRAPTSPPTSHRRRSSMSGRSRLALSSAAAFTLGDSIPGPVLAPPDAGGGVLAHTGVELIATARKTSTGQSDRRSWRRRIPGLSHAGDEQQVVPQPDPPPGSRFGSSSAGRSRTSARSAPRNSPSGNAGRTPPSPHSSRSAPVVGSPPAAAAASSGSRALSRD